ncbi:hypothetical protein [Rhodococcus spongiicola]|uniref:hypothetical protein n=1 Tax=Rhodococcus spongiicola TaxID=2487352 RepID=UPI000FDECD03|nr:hypothetical protein [Rhodococcus spongiicola]
MIKSVRAAVTAALAAPVLAVAFAAPANAAPEDVALSVDVVGNDVEVIIANDSDGMIECAWAASSGLFGETHVRINVFVQPDAVYREPVTVADGRYDVIWNCESVPGVEAWGNTSETGTADPLTFIAPPCSSSGSLDILGSMDFGNFGSTETGSASTADAGSGGSVGSHCAGLGGS